MNNTSKGYKWMTNGIDRIYIKNDQFNNYLSQGWKFGMDDEFKRKNSLLKIGKSSGKCLDPQKELERKQKISNSMKGNKNWMFNKHHGNAKQGWYKNIHCDSTWELAFLVYHIEHNLNIKRCDKQFNFYWENEIHKYIPDFITDEGIIEIKGRKSTKSLEKEKQFPNIKVIDQNLIKPYLEYVINKYGEEFWKQLYENYSKDYQEQQYTDKINRKIKKQKETENRRIILENACKNSNIDFSKFGWSNKLVNYLDNRNELFDKLIFRALKKYYKEFFNIYKPFIRKSSKIIL